MEAVQYHFSTFVLSLRVLVDSIKGFPGSEPWNMWPRHLQERVDNFQFPSITELLYPALVCCIILSAIRFVLQYFVFRVRNQLTVDLRLLLLICGLVSSEIGHLLSRHKGGEIRS